MYHFSAFFPTKTTGIIRIHFGYNVGKYGPGTEFPRIFCAGIGPMQLGVVLVFFKFMPGPISNPNPGTLSWFRVP